MLIKLFDQLIAKPQCESCSVRLNKSRIFCGNCQAELYYQLINLPIQPAFDLSHASFIHRLFQLAQSERNTFLIDLLAALVVLKVHSSGVWPQHLMRGALFSSKKSNRHFDQKIAKISGIKMLSSEETLSSLSIAIVL